MGAKKSGSDFYSKAVFFSLLGIGVVVGLLVTFLKLTGTLR